MQIIAQCPACGSSWRLGAEAADRRITCRKCRKLFKLPKLEELHKATGTLKEAKTAVYVDESGKLYG